MEVKMLNKKMQEIVLTILVLAVIFFVALIGGRFGFRIDATQNKTFTISEVSRNLFLEIPEEVEITYYLSEKLRNYTPVPGEVEDTLYEYAASSRGKIHIRIVDPADMEDTQEIENAGIAPQQIQVVEDNEQSFAVVYSGIVIRNLDDYKVLPLVFDTTTLEYDLTSSIKSLLGESERTIGIISGENSAPVNEAYRLLASNLARSFQVREVNRGEDVPDDITVLFVFGSMDLDEFDLYPIDQYIMRGGKVLFGVDTVYVDVARNLAAEPKFEAPLLGMIEKYGIEIGHELVLDKFAKRIPVRQARGKVVIQSLEHYPHWIAVGGKYVSTDNPVTARFSGLDLLWASPLYLKETDGVNAEILIETSPEAWLMRDRFTTNPYEAPVFSLQADETRGQYILGAAQSGSFQSYFSGRTIPSREGVERDWTAVIEHSNDTRMLVIGDSDFGKDIIQASDSGYNIRFIENCAEWLSNDDDLLDIKTRAAFDMRLNKIEQPEVKDTVIFLAQFVNIYLLPLLCILFGVIYWLRRREKAPVKKGEQS
jgi:gliding-associated putative ABC transporter substrate-binding component GldG